MPAHRRLPPRAELRRLYVGKNMSVQQLADTYGVGYRAVLDTMRRDALLDGVAWPLKGVGTGTHLPRKVVAIRRGRDEVKATLVAMEIRECLQSYGVSQHRLASMVEGLHQGTLSRITTGEVEWVRRSTAEAVQRAVTSVETRAAISAGVKRAAATRNALAQ